MPESTLDLLRLDGRVAVVTGAGRGIGAAAAAALADAGADVVIAARTADELEQVAARVRAAGREAEVVVADLTDLDAVAALAATAVERFGRLDVVVNNLGAEMPRPFLDTSPAELQAAFAFNVSTAHALTTAAVPRMLAGDGDGAGGAVVNVSSAMGHYFGRGYLAYSTAKAALSAYTRAAAQDLAPRIRVNAVAVAAVATSALESVLTDEALRDAMVEATPLHRIATPQEAGAAILYLASPATAYMTGSVLHLDGGTQQPNLSLGLPDL